MIGVILERVAGLRVGEDGQSFSIEHQPRNHVRELLLADGELTAPPRMRPDRIVVHPSDLDAERLAGVLAKLLGLRAGLWRVVIDVGVKVLDLGHAIRPPPRCSSRRNGYPDAAV